MYARNRTTSTSFQREPLIEIKTNEENKENVFRFSENIDDEYILKINSVINERIARSSRLNHLINSNSQEYDAIDLQNRLTIITEDLILLKKQKIHMLNNYQS